MPILRPLKNTEPIPLAFNGTEGEAMEDLDGDGVAKVAEIASVASFSIPNANKTLLASVLQIPSLRQDVF